jgi:DNA primase
MSRAVMIRKWLREAGAERIRDSGVNHLVSSCPYHKDRHPSFSINTETGLFTCYSGGCAVSGNLINFLMTALNWPFKKARDASDMVDIPNLDDESVYTLPSFERRRCLVLEVPDRVFGEGHLGMYRFCPRYMIDRGYTKADLKTWEVGYDYGTSRVTIPVRSADGRLLGITKRSTTDDQLPKYLHLGFKKGSHLFGANKLTDGYRSEIAIVEGQVDVIAWYAMLKRYNLPPMRCVSTMGSRVSQAQINLMARYRRVYLAYDNDEDGRGAMMRTGEGLISKMKPSNLMVLSRWPKDCKDIGDIYEKQVSEVKVRRFLTTGVPYQDIRLDMMGFI